MVYNVNKGINCFYDYTILNNAPQGLSINNIEPLSSSEIGVVLSYNETGIDTDITDFSVSISSSGTNCYHSEN